jgi:uncharacterized membrane protein YphA (DoxX/SURF4 family)
LLRLTVALHTIIGAACALLASNGLEFAVWACGLLSITLGIALLLGFFTPLAGATTTIGYFILGISSLLKMETIRPIGPATAINLTAISLALVFLGPGAFSVDARLFGRREIIIPEARHAPHP